MPRIFARLLLATLTVTALLLLLTTPAQAKMDAFVVQGPDGELYEYGYLDLLESYALSLLDSPSPLFDHYVGKNMYAYWDDINGYVDYADVLDAYALALLTGKSFDLDDYTAGAQARPAEISRVQVVSLEQGQLKFREKVLADPLDQALAEVNGAGDAPGLRAILEARAQILGLSLQEYAQLSEGGKNAVAQGVLAQRGSGYQDAIALAAVFAQEVERALADIGHLLEALNSAVDQQAFAELLLEHGQELGLDLNPYTMVISSRRERVIAPLYAAAPYPSPEALRTRFDEAVASVLSSYAIVSFTDYQLTLAEMVDIQMTCKPQWHVSGRGWQDAPRAEVEHYVNPSTFLPGDLAESVAEIIITADVLNLRDTPSSHGTRVGAVRKGEIYPVAEAVEVTEGTAPDSLGYWFLIDLGDVQGWACGNYADWVTETYTPQMFQFLTLSGRSGITAAELGKILAGKGILLGMEAVFFQASRENNINEIFLTSMALHETGNGTSQLANGILFTPEDPDLEPRMVYNMFGINAVDSNPLYKGAEFAYNQGWFTPEAAIRGGAVFVAKNYVNHAAYGQDTLYKIRWNPGRPGLHQYATDIGWASKQTGFIRQLYQQVNIYSLKFDIPRYRR